MINISSFSKLFRQPTFLLLIGIIIFGIFIRIYNLSDLPKGFHIDEVKVGWNAYSILKTGKDDWGDRFSLYYDSIGDYRPTGIFYITIPSIQLLGLSVFAVRLPGALFGVGTIIVVYLITYELTKNKKVATSASGLTAISPWQIVISRATSEAMMADFFVLVGVYFLIRGLNVKNKIYIFLSAIGFLPSFFLYHSVRILIPLIIFITIIYYLKYLHIKYTSKFNFTLIGLLIGTILTFLIISLNPSARARLNQVFIPSDVSIQKFQNIMPTEEGSNHILESRIFHNKYVIYTTTFINNYFSYLSPSFFITPNVAKPDRYATVNNGIITYVEFILFLIGVISIIPKRFSALPLLLFLAAPLPAALTIEDVPNMHRALLMSPFLSIIAGFGFMSLISIKKYGNKLAILTIIFLTINFVYFWHMYSVHNAVHSPLFLNRNIGAIELAQLLTTEQNKYDKIYITNSPDEFYPWYAFFNKPDPAVFNQLVASRGRLPWERSPWQYKNIIFTRSTCPSEIFLQHPIGNIAVVDNGESCLKPNYPGIILNDVIKVNREGGGVPYVLRTYSLDTTQPIN